MAIAVPHTGAAVDPEKRNEAFAPKPAEQERVEKERTQVGESRPAADQEVAFVTVPAADAKARRPEIVEKRRASIATTTTTVPARKPEAASISTSQAVPEKFEKKFASPKASRLQEGLTDANRVTTTKVKPAKKPSVIERINRFVFRRNEPAPGTTPAGGEDQPAEGTPAQSSSGGS